MIARTSSRRAGDQRLLVHAWCSSVRPACKKVTLLGRFFSQARPSSATDPFVVIRNDRN
jgi:hypothetical protein